MRAILLIATLALAGCDQRSELTKYNEDMAKVWAERDAEKARKDAEYRADATRWAIEENTQELQNLNSKLRRR